MTTCSDPGTPDNGTQTSPEGFHVGSSLIFTCDTGYLMAGDATRSCKETGLWTGVQPKCGLPHSFGKKASS